MWVLILNSLTSVSCRFDLIQLARTIATQSINSEQLVKTAYKYWHTTQTQKSKRPKIHFNKSGETFFFSTFSRCLYWLISAIFLRLHVWCFWKIIHFHSFEIKPHIIIQILLSSGEYCRTKLELECFVVILQSNIQRYH